MPEQTVKIEMNTDQNSGGKDTFSKIQTCVGKNMVRKMHGYQIHLVLCPGKYPFKMYPG